MVAHAGDEWSGTLTRIVARWQGEQGEPKQDRSRRRRREILQAAVRVFARTGIARARIGDVAAEAGVPVSSVYDYYPGKEDLAYAVPIARMGKFYIEFAEAAQTEPTARERLRLYLWLTADFARRDPDWARTLYLEVWPSVLVKEARVRECLDDFARIVIALIRDGGARGEWPVDPNPYQTATILVGSVSQLIITWLLYRRPRDLMRATSHLIDRLMPLLSVDGTSVQPRTRSARQAAKSRLSRRTE
jgi:AcrR family transcriptional regulator